MADTKEEIFCPACGKKMEKLFMPESGVYLDICTEGCGGIFFDNREFSKFDEKDEDIKPLEDLLGDKTFSRVDTTLVRVCPVCGTNMVKNHSSAKHKVEIDNCYGCGGIFLDNCELQLIREEYETEEMRAEDAVAELYKSVGAELTKEKMKYEQAKKGVFGHIYGCYVKFGTKIIKKHL